MTLDETMAALKAMGTEQTRKTFVRHGASADCMFGVKVGDMKTLVKKIKVDQALALKLFATGNSDAQYLAGLIADDMAFTKKDLQAWADTAAWHMLGEYTVPWVAAGSPFGWEMANKWIDAKKPALQATGWSTLSNIVGVKPDDELDLKAIEKLIGRVAKDVHAAANRVKYTMMGFLISVGCYVEPLSKLVKLTVPKIGKVEIDMGDTACKIPNPLEYIAKVESMDRLGVKRKQAKC
ncbi:DNA alkylation repair protein [soil metagenome]